MAFISDHFRKSACVGGSCSSSVDYLDCCVCLAGEQPWISVRDCARAQISCSNGCNDLSLVGSGVDSTTILGEC